MKATDSKLVLAQNIQKYMDKRGITRQQLCDDLDIKYTTLRDWLKGITYPRIGKLEAMANYFGCEKSDLIEDKTEIQKKNDALASIVIRAQTDEVFMAAIEALYRQDEKKLLSILSLLD